MDGDLCTISGHEELEDLVNSDLVKERNGTLRLQVIPKRASILHRRDSSDQSGTSTIGKREQKAMICVNTYKLFRGNKKKNNENGGRADKQTPLVFLLCTVYFPPFGHQMRWLADSKPGKIQFDNEYTDCDMLEILRDISLFICARGMDRHSENGLWQNDFFFFFFALMKWW